jgi:ProP effector
MVPIADLQARFPGVFVADGERRPLAVGIHLDLIARLPEWDPKLVRQALCAYCLADRYLRGLQEGATRVDLTGAAAGVVTAEQAADARLRLQHRAERRAAQAARRKAEKAAKPAQPAKSGPKGARKPQAGPTPPATRRRLSLAGLREAARQRAAGRAA